MHEYAKKKIISEIKKYLFSDLHVVTELKRDIAVEVIQVFHS